MSAAQVTEAHLRLANQLVSSPPSPLVLATLIADSEAKAVAEWKDSVHLQGEAIDSLLLECGRLRAELATERARRDWLGSGFWITGEPCDRAAIDAAIKEETK